MDINQLLNELKETYSFSNVTYTQTPGEAMTNFVFCLTQDQITRFIEKAGRLNSIVESCANMISICEPGLKDTLMATTIRCMGANELHIRTCESMIKMLIQSLFD